VKAIADDVLGHILARHGYAELDWTRSIPIPGDDDFPVLQLPDTKLRYATERGYPVKLEPRKVSGHPPLLFVQIESFAIAGHDQASWAEPIHKYTPQTDDERVNQELGFDEGWDDAELESILVFDSQFAVFWRAVHERQRFGLTAPETQSLYPVVLEKKDRAALGKLLGKWPR
jgi:hypothetical protein